jgi:hypothetical protein
MNKKILLPSFLSNVTINIAHVEPELSRMTARGVLWQAAEGRFLLEVPSVARYLVEAGESITIDPVPGVDVFTIERFLRMAPMAAMLYQQGKIAFHASAIACKHGAILIAGDSGVGKSTLLMELLRRGWEMMADELVAVELDNHGHPIVYPTFAEIALRPDSMKKLGVYSDTLPYYDSYRFEYSLPKQLIATSQPLFALYCLYTFSKSNCELATFDGISRFGVLGKLMYNSHIADAVFDRVVYMRCAAKISQSVKLNKLGRPRNIWSVNELADIITAQV